MERLRASLCHYTSRMLWLLWWPWGLEIFPDLWLAHTGRSVRKIQSWLPLITKRTKDIPAQGKARSHGYCWPYRQWVYDTQNVNTPNGEYTIQIPISMNFLGCATSGTGDDSTNIIGWSTTSIIVKTFKSHQTDTAHQVRRPFHAILIGKN